MSRCVFVLLVCSLPLAAAAGHGRVGKRISLVENTQRLVRVKHGKNTQIGSLPFFGYALLVTVRGAQKKPRARVEGLLLPARSSSDNAPPLEKRRSTPVLRLAPAADALVRAALKATGFPGEVRIAHGR